MIADPESKTEPSDLAQTLDLELLQKRAERQRNNARYRTARALSFFFLFLVLAGSALAFFFLFSQLSQRQARQDDATSLTVPER